MPNSITDADRHEFLRLRDKTGTHGVLALNGTSIVGYVDHDMANMLGYTPGELEGAPLETVLPERMQDVHEQEVVKFNGSKDTHARGMKHHDRTIAGIHRERNDDGSKRHVELLSTIHVVNGHPCVFVLSPTSWREGIVNALGERS